MAGAELYKTLTPAPPRYFDRKFHGDEAMYFKKLDQSCTLYVGNLSFYTSEEQIFELFSTAGDVKRIIMGLDRVAKTPCGFCFVEYERSSSSSVCERALTRPDSRRYYNRAAAENCMRYLNGTALDERLVRTDWDPGFELDRQFGRGRSGGQVRDEYRPDFDQARGGFGRQFQRQQPSAYTEYQSTSGGGGGSSSSAAPTSTGAGSKRSLDESDDPSSSNEPRSKRRDRRGDDDDDDDDKDDRRARD